MKQSRRIIALGGVVLLVLLYVSALVFALIDSPLAFGLLKTALLLTFLLPILIYFVTMAMKSGTDLFEEEKKGSDDQPESKR